MSSQRIITVLPTKLVVLLSYNFLLHLRKKESMGMCFPSLEDLSFFLGVGMKVEHGRSASLPNMEQEDNGDQVNVTSSSSHL